MRIRHAHPHQPAGKINVTPLIDVVMVLIIFYLIVGNLAAQRMAPVDLPAAASGAAEEGAPTLVVTVSSGPNGSTYVVDGKTIPREELENLVRARVSAPGMTPATASVHIRADRSLPYVHVAPVVDACRAVGLSSVKLVADRGDAS